MKQNVIKPRNINVFLLFLLFVLFLSISNVNQYTSSKIISKDDNYNPNYTDHSPIIINSDDDFVTYGFSGSGTANDPYLIENYRISATYSEAISISSTTKCFVIQNCLLQDSIFGIYLTSIQADTGNISYNIFRRNDASIYVYNSDSVIISSNKFWDNAGHISVEYSSGMNITHNIMSHQGLHIFYETNPSVLFSYNVFNNTVDSKPIGWFLNQENLTISTPDYGQIFLINCADSKIENQVMYKPTIGISVFAGENITIENNISGIIMTGVSDSLVLNNWGNTKYIAVCDSFSVNISENSMHHGIHTYYSHDIDITNNTIQGNFIGMYLDDCYSCNIINNTISFNDELSLYIVFSNNIIVANNTIYKSSIYGIKLIECSYIELFYNLIQECTEYGMYIDEFSSKNVIHHNSFYFNNIAGTSQAYDDGSDNTWFEISTNEGNYWSDWSTGNYSIDGISGAEDPYPLITPIHDPTVISEFTINKGMIISFFILSLSFACLLLKKRKR